MTPVRKDVERRTGKRPHGAVAVRARGSIVELPFAWMRQHFRIHKRSLRGRKRVTSIVVLAALTFDIPKRGRPLLASVG
jgi:hypothetical protein